MKRLLNPFVVAITAILAAGYGYLAWRLTAGAVARLALALPFVMVWIVPVIYWVGDRQNRGWIDEAVHFMSYLCMGWLNFAVVLCAARDGLLLATSLLPPFSGMHALLRDAGATWVWVGSVVALERARSRRCAARMCATWTFRSKDSMPVWRACASCRSATSTWDRRSAVDTCGASCA